jgi:glyceraldehyde 3-phosphate dehydrogenase
MTYNIAINGFGRIGRQILRAFLERYDKNINIVAINDLSPTKDNAHLLKYDSIHGRLNNHVTVENNTMHIDQHSIQMFSEKDPSILPWKNLKIDIVLECSGRFTKKADASKHLGAGARYVLISAPSPDPDFTVVYGVNHLNINNDHHIISNASCTTNCLAPIAKILHDEIGIERGYMTTIHAYTGDQRLVDTWHNDLQRARAACESMIPSSTGAAKAVGLVLPELNGKLDGSSIRVPTANVSVIDFTFTSQKFTSIDNINEIVVKMSQGAMHGIIDTVDIPLVSKDFNHQPFSSIFDLAQTQVIDGRFCRVLSWYDNEWGFSNRMLDVATYWLCR